MTFGITFGAFDLLHPGHIVFIQQCLAQCDDLCIGLHVDPSHERREKNAPVQTVLERYIQLAALKSVKYIFPYETEIDLIRALVYYSPDVRFLGSDYEGKTATGELACATIGCRVIYIARNHTWSTTELRKRATSRGKRTKSPSVQ